MISCLGFCVNNNIVKYAKMTMDNNKNITLENFGVRYVKESLKKEFVLFRDYVRSVTNRGSYNSVSFLANTNIRGNKAPLVSAMCFENDTGLDYKKLTEHTKGRFVTIVAEVRYKDGKKSYKAIGVSIAPKEFKEETHPIDDMDAPPDFDEYEQLSFDFVNDEVGKDE